VPKEDAVWRKHLLSFTTVTVTPATLKSPTAFSRALKASLSEVPALLSTRSFATVGTAERELGAETPHAGVEGVALSTPSSPTEPAYDSYKAAVTVHGVATLLHNGALGLGTGLTWAPKQSGLQQKPARCVYRIFVRCGRQVTSSIELWQHDPPASAPMHSSKGVQLAETWSLLVRIPLQLAALCIARAPKEFARGCDDVQDCTEAQAARPWEGVPLVSTCVHTVDKECWVDALGQLAQVACWPWVRQAGVGVGNVDSDSDSSEDGLGLWRW
jgi:hypothetical protein